MFTYILKFNQICNTYGRYHEVATMTWVTRSHHVLGIEHLLGEFRDSEGLVLLATSAGQRCGSGGHGDGGKGTILTANL